MDEDYTNNLPTPTLDQNQFPPAPQKNAGNTFPFDSATKLTMDPHSKRKRPIETLGDGEPSHNPDLQPGISVGVPQRARDGGQSAGSMPAQGSTFTTQGAPGWSSTPPGKTFNKDSEFSIKAKPVK